MLRSASTVTVIDFEMLHGFTWIRELILMNIVNVTLLIVQFCTPLPRFGMSQKTVSNFIYVCILAEQNNLEQKVLTVHQVLSIICSLFVIAAQLRKSHAVLLLFKEWRTIQRCSDQL